MHPSAMRSTLEQIIIYQFTPLHCAQAREILGWNFEQLSHASKVSVPAIQRFEAGEPIRDVTLLALAHRLEAEGLVQRDVPVRAAARPAQHEALPAARVLPQKVAQDFRRQVRGQIGAQAVGKALR